MSNSPNEQNICKGCNREDCKGSPEECERDVMESEEDRKYHLKNEEL